MFHFSSSAWSLLLFCFHYGPPADSFLLHFLPFNWPYVLDASLLHSQMTHCQLALTLAELPAGVPWPSSFLTAHGKVHSNPWAAVLCSLLWDRKVHFSCLLPAVVPHWAVRMNERDFRCGLIFVLHFFKSIWIQLETLFHNYHLPLCCLDVTPAFYIKLQALEGDKFFF